MNASRLLLVNALNFTVSAIRQLYLQISDMISNAFWAFQQIDQNRVKEGQVFCKNPEQVSKLIEKFRHDGPSKLTVIADFDHTLTRFTNASGERVPSCYGLFSVTQNPAITPELKNTLKHLYEKYYPIEASGSLSSSRKQEIMEEWWANTHKALVDAQLSLDVLHQIVSENFGQLPLRDGTTSLFAMLYEFNVVIHIFSGGIGLFIRHCLENLSNMFNNKIVHITANEFIFDGQTLTGFKQPVICGRKTGRSMLDVRKSSEERCNVVLFGDMIGDSLMTEDLTNVNAVLKLGFFNDAKYRAKQDLQAYIDAFDVVFCDETTVNGITAILKLILGDDDH